jgi:hypothetical protein
MGLINKKRNEHDVFIDQQVQKWIKPKSSSDGFIQNRLVIYLTGLIHAGHKKYVQAKIDEIVQRLANNGFEINQYQEVLNLMKECD